MTKNIIKAEFRKSTLDRKVSQYKDLLKRDEDGDYRFALMMFSYKLGRTRSYITRNASLSEKKKKEIISEIRQVENLLQKVVEDKYLDKCMKKAKRKVPLDFQMESACVERAFDERKADLEKAFNVMLSKIWFWWVSSPKSMET